MSLWKNPPLLIAIALPAIAVLASFASLALVLMHPDGELPEQYHWEGFQLDRDFSRAERATALAVRARLRNFGGAGACEIDLEITGPPPDALTLTLAHATQAERDQHLRLPRVSDEQNSRAGRATYATPCKAIALGHWRLELEDAAQTWSVRGSLRGSLLDAQLDARRTEDD